MSDRRETAQKAASKNGAPIKGLSSRKGGNQQALKASKSPSKATTKPWIYQIKRNPTQRNPHRNQQNQNIAEKDHPEDLHKGTKRNR